MVLCFPVPRFQSPHTAGRTDGPHGERMASVRREKAPRQLYTEARRLRDRRQSTQLHCRAVAGLLLLYGLSRRGTIKAVPDK